MAEITMISIDKLYPHPDNPRKHIGDVTELGYEMSGEEREMQQGTHKVFQSEE